MIVTALKNLIVSMQNTVGPVRRETGFTFGVLKTWLLCPPGANPCDI